MAIVAYCFDQSWHGHTLYMYSYEYLTILEKDELMTREPLTSMH